MHFSTNINESWSQKKHNYVGQIEKWTNPLYSSGFFIAFQKKKFQNSNVLTIFMPVWTLIVIRIDVKRWPPYGCGFLMKIQDGARTDTDFLFFEYDGWT